MINSVSDHVVYRESECIVCSKKTTMRCGECKLVYYCRRDCILFDWLNHKKICRKTLPEVLKAIYQEHTKRKCIDRLCKDQISISRHEHVFSKNYFIRIRKLFNDNRHFCCTCGKDIIYAGPTFDLACFTTKDGHKIEYYRCTECIGKYYLLCPFSFYSSHLCINNHLNTIIQFGLGIKFNYPSIPKEIIILIFQFCLTMKCV